MRRPGSDIDVCPSWTPSREQSPSLRCLTKQRNSRQCLVEECNQLGLVFDAVWSAATCLTMPTVGWHQSLPLCGHGGCRLAEVLDDQASSWPLALHRRLYDGTVAGESEQEQQRALIELAVEQANRIADGFAKAIKTLPQNTSKGSLAMLEHQTESLRKLAFALNVERYGDPIDKEKVRLIGKAMRWTLNAAGNAAVAVGLNLSLFGPPSEPLSESFDQCIAAVESIIENDGQHFEESPTVEGRGDLSVEDTHSVGGAASAFATIEESVALVEALRSSAESENMDRFVDELGGVTDALAMLKKIAAAAYLPAEAFEDETEQEEEDATESNG